jgi:hypothetical protein
MSPNSAVTLVTPSYRNDYELVLDLCKSLDEFFIDDFIHLLIVPECDVELFSCLASPSRRVISEKNLLSPFGFYKLPFPRRLRLPGFFDLKIREQWYCRGIGRLSGWVIQQLLKLSVSELTANELILFADSDNLLVRPFGLSRFYEGSAIKLARKPLNSELHNHMTWYRNAQSLLGIKDVGQEKFNYIGNFIMWRRSTLVAMQQRIAKISGIDWRIAVAKKKDISEWILYGLHCETSPNLGGHVFCLNDWVCSYWTSDIRMDPIEMAKSLQDTHAALHIQSTIPLPIERRRSIMSQLTTILLRKS